MTLFQLWLTLAERHLEQRGVDWKQAEKVCFNEWSNPDDEELGIQIVKVRISAQYCLNTQKCVEIVCKRLRLPKC